MLQGGFWIMFPAFNWTSGTWQIGRFDRTPVVLHSGFFVTAVLLTSSYWLRGRFALAIIAIAILFVSILVHELSHAFFGRRYRVPMAVIAVHYLGGHVQFLDRPWRRIEDFIITLAGPLSNLGLAGIAWLVLQTIPAGEPHTVMVIGSQIIQGPPTPGLIGRALTIAVYVNVGLAIINMIPGFPLDGGRLMFLAAEPRLGRRRASMIVGYFGMIFAGVNIIVFVGSALSGFPILAPPSFTQNLEVFQNARSGRAYAF